MFINSDTRDFTISSLNQVMPIISPYLSLLTSKSFYYMIICMYILFLLAFCNQLPLFVHFQRFWDSYFARGGDPFGTQLPKVCFQKNHIGVTVYLLNSLLLGISSHGYAKGILWVLGYNNCYANIGLALFKGRFNQIRLGKKKRKIKWTIMKTSLNIIHVGCHDSNKTLKCLATRTSYLKHEGSLIIWG